MHKNNMVAVIKVGDSTLREREGNVYLPFGTEYSIFLKNLNTKKAKVNINIDGEDVLFGKSIIINPDQEVNLDRYVMDLERGNRFKFIKKTKEISDYRGDKTEDGIVRVEFVYEVDKPTVLNFKFDWYYRPYIIGGFEYNPLIGGFEYNPFSSTFKQEQNIYGSNDSTFKQEQNIYGSNDSTFKQEQNIYGSNDSTFKQEQNENCGITVPGSVSNKEFIPTERLNNLEPNSYVMCFFLKGTDGKRNISNPLTTNDKLVCSTCGNKEKGCANFCSRCGTSLKII